MNIWIFTNLNFTYMPKYRVDQHSIVLDLYFISINKIPLTEIMAETKFHWI